MSSRKLINFLAEADKLEQSGQPGRAAEAAHRALALAPKSDEIRLYLAKLLKQSGRPDEAYAHYRHQLKLGRTDLDLQVNLVEMLALQTGRDDDPAIESEIRQCLAFPNVDYNRLARVAAARLNLKHPAAVGAGAPDPAAYCADDFLMHCLAKIYFTDQDLELKLKALRRVLLLEILASGTLRHDRMDLVAAMALQGANNEYILDRDEQEQQMLAALLELQEAMIAGDGESAGLLGAVLTAAMYMPICDMPVAHRLQTVPLSDWPKGVRPLISATLLERRVERGIAAAIPGLRPIRDEVSRRVREQYEAHPYPRWLSVAYRPPVGYRADLQSRLPRIELPAILDRGKLEILVAGCGTGRQPISIAKTYENISVTALDLSGMSLAYGIRMAAGMGIDNIEFYQGDILDLPHLEKRFAIIYCSGVLHHMHDPVVGWRVLRDMLEPGGLMNIGLYSERARAVIVRAREIIAESGIGNDAESIRAFRRDVLAGRYGQELAPLTRISDFYSLSGCRDLVFHVQEHRFSLPRIDEIRRELGLATLGFNLLPPSYLDAYRKSFPQDPAMTDLANWDRLEEKNPGMFLNMYNLWFRTE